MIYSASRQKTFCRCPRLFYHNYIQGYKQLVKSPWLDFGSHIDDLLSVYDTEGFDKMMEAIPSFFSDHYEIIDVQQLLTYYHEKFGHDPQPPIELDGKPGNQWHFEMTLEAPHIEGCDIRVQGYIDKVIEMDNWVAFVERKTTSAAINYVSQYWAGLEIDKQVVGYSWALSKTIGGDVNRCIYEVLRKPASVSSKFLKRKDTKKNPVPLDEYEDSVKEYFQNPTQDMVARRKLWIPPSARNEWAHDLVADDDAIQNMTLNQSTYQKGRIDGRYAWPRNQGACKDYGGCLFYPVCSGETEVDRLQTVFKQEE